MFARRHTNTTQFVSWMVALVMVITMLMLPASAPSTMAAVETSSFIVQGASAEQVASLVEAYGGEVTSMLDIIEGVGANLSQATAARLMSDSAITAVTLSNQMRTNSVPSLTGNKKGNPSIFCQMGKN